MLSAAGDNLKLIQDVADLKRQLRDLAFEDILQIASSDGTASQMQILANADGAGNAGLVFVRGSAVGRVTVDASGRISVSNGQVITAGGLTVSAGGLTVSAGGATVTGDSTFQNGLTVNGTSSFNSALTVSSGGLTVSANGLLVHGSATIYNGAAFPTGGSVTIADNLTVSGTKAFAMPHPTTPGATLVHASTESPVNGVEYWGTGTIPTGSQAVLITLPSYFEALTKAGNRAVLVTPIMTGQGNNVPGVGASAITNGQFTVYGPSGASFSWLVKAERMGSQDAPVEFDPEFYGTPDHSRRRGQDADKIPIPHDRPSQAMTAAGQQPLKGNQS